MFTKGTASLKNEGAYRVLAAAQELEKQGKSIVHFEIGQPDFATPDFISSSGIEAIKNGKTTYCNPSGILDLKNAIAEYISVTRKLSTPVTQENVVIGPGAKPGMWFAVQALVREGDEIIIPDPGFPTYSNMVNAFGGKSVPYRCIPKAGVPVSEQAGLSVADEIVKCVTDKTRLIVINSPSNPTGDVISSEDLEKIAEFVTSTFQKTGQKIWVMSDEIYARLAYVDETGKQNGSTSNGNGKVDFSALSVTPSIITCKGMQDFTIIVDGFSKTFSMTGWRLGFVICPANLAERLHLLMTHAIGCTAPFTQYAGLAAITGLQDAAKEMLVEYRKRRDYVVSRLEKMPGVKCRSPGGAFYAFPDISALGVTSQELSTRALNEGHVAILPGTDFGACGEGYIRISYVCSLAVLEEGLNRLEKVITQIHENNSQGNDSKKQKA